MHRRCTGAAAGIAGKLADGLRGDLALASRQRET